MHYFIFGSISGVVIGGFGFYELGKLKASQAVKAIQVVASSRIQQQ